MDNKTEIVRSTEKPKREKETWEIRLSVLEWIAGIAFLGLTAWFIISLFCGNKSSEINNIFGTYGDLIGGILGTFVAYISVRLLASTLRKQIDAYNENSSHNEETANVYRVQQFDEQFQILFKLYRNIMFEYKEVSPNGIDLASIVNQYEAKSQTTEGRNYEDRRAKAIEIFNEFYVTYLSVASVHFRLLYRIFQLIDDADIPDKNKTTIAKIMRCQLAPEELFLLRYNAMTDNGQKMQLYINRYNLLKHLPIMSLMEFSNLSVKLDDKQRNSVNSEIVSWKKKIKELLLTTTDKAGKLYFTNNYGKKYIFEVNISPSKNQCDFKLTKDVKAKLQNSPTTDFASALDKFTDKELDDFLLNFAKELFLYSNFSQYNSPSSLEIKPEITEKKVDRKKIISVVVRKKDNSQLICSQRQLEAPVERQDDNK